MPIKYLQAREMSICGPSLLPNRSKYSWLGLRLRRPTKGDTLSPGGTGRFEIRHRMGPPTTSASGERGQVDVERESVRAGSAVVMSLYVGS